MFRAGASGLCGRLECNGEALKAPVEAMTEEEALKLVEEREGRLCVRFYQRRDGTVLTTDCPVGAAKAMPMLGGINEMGP